MTIGNGPKGCYPQHLNLLTLLSAKLLDLKISRTSSELFCARTTGKGLYLNDWFCHKDYDSFFTEFELNKYEYRHQRCNAEGPDYPDHAETGIETPAVDFLILFAAATGELIH